MDRLEAGTQEHSFASWTPGGCDDAVTQDALLRKVLAENKDDFMSLGMLVHFVKSAKQLDGEELRLDVLLSLEKLLDDGLMTVGCVEHRQFIPWTCNALEAVGLIAGRWPNGIELEYSALASICWLTNTLKGNEISM